MKAIKVFKILPLVLILMACSEEREELVLEERFVRFSVQEGSDNRIVEAPEIPPSALEIERFVSQSVSRIKLPVKLSQTSGIDVQVGFELEGANLVEGIDYNLTPSTKTLNFVNGALVDTIVVTPLSRFEQTDSLVLKLNSVSDGQVALGYPREEKKLDSFTLIFNETPEKLPVSFDTNRIEISGEEDEMVNFRLEFPLGFIASELQGQELFIRTGAFDYALEEVANDGFRFIDYKIINTNQLAADQAFVETLTILENEDYRVGTLANLQIVKPLAVEREGVPTFSWYNLSNQFYRNFGEHWRMVNGDCQWRAWNVFTVPVAVEPNSEFDSDGDGHHDFKIGFISPTGLGTNPFDLRRIFDGESVQSPGLNLIEAMEFFPENGTNPTRGTVQVIPQIATLIKTADGTAYDIPISGSGEYERIDEATNLWRMRFNFEVNLSALGLPNQTRKMYLYNQSGQPDPSEEPGNCFDTLDL